jgi:hypothetical protein
MGKIKFYAAVATAMVVAMIGFDSLWMFTEISVEDCLALSLFMALGVAIAFMFLVDAEEERTQEHDEDQEMSSGDARFVTVDGLNVLIQRSRRFDGSTRRSA